MSVEVLVIIGIVFIVVLLGILFLIPSDKKGKKKKKKSQAEPLGQQKDWEQKALRLEKYIHSLRDDILAFQKKEKVTEKQLTIERAKVKKFQEKLSQEREWSKKEQNVIDKKGKEFQQLKAELRNAQESFSKEHVTNLRYEQEIKELKQQNDSFNEQRRSVEGENAQLKAKNENHRKEIAHLKKENRQLSKKEEDASWIAKSEYERVTKLLKEKEKELNRVSRETKE